MSPSQEKNYGLIRETAGVACLKEIPIPPLQDDYILVRTVAIALNPTDWTTLDAKGDAGTLVGCDYAGIVEAVGKDVKKAFKKGDRIAGFGHGGNDANPWTGAFARYIAVKGDVQLHVPDHVSFEEASSVGAGVTTTGFGLYDVLGLPFPDETPTDTGKPILIYGGSTATGTIAIQFAKLSGRKVITTTSPRNFELVKDRGADLVFDYRDPDVARKIREATNNQLDEIFDTVALEDTVKICSDSMGENGGIYCNLLGIDSPRADIKSIFFLGYQISGEDYIFEGETYAAIPEKFELGVKFFAVADKLWAARKFKNHPLRVGSGGLLGALEGMQTMREGKYSGEKLVYQVDETEWPLS